MFLYILTVNNLDSVSALSNKKSSIKIVRNHRYWLIVICMVHVITSNRRIAYDCSSFGNFYDFVYSLLCNARFVLATADHLFYLCSNYAKFNFICASRTFILFLVHVAVFVFTSPARN